MMKFKKNVFAFLLMTMIFLVGANSAFATACFRDDYTNNAPALGDGDSWAIGIQQASNTWDDWIWRGPIFRCSTSGTNNCTYAWGETKTTGYSWSVGASLDGGAGIPIVGSVLSLLHIDGRYGRDQSYSTNFTWSVNVQPGYYAQPIQVVVRRWKSGVFQGMQVNTGRKCVWGGGPDVHDGHWYDWDGSRRYGHWEANVEESRYATYYVHK